MKAESSKATKRRLSPETLELTRQRGIVRAAGNRELMSELAKQCRLAIKEDLKDRRAAVIVEAAEAGKSMRKARRSFANYKNKMIALRRPRRNNNSVQKGNGENHSRLLLRSLR
uniref:30S ribosomal protein S20 n=1 Tax=Angiostrongylus cantonensis TaxID=6313 RepID=A0A0K0D8H8_ANGCA